MATLDLDQIVADIELKQEQLRQLKTIDIELKLRQYRFEPWRLVAIMVFASAVIVGASTGFLGYKIGSRTPPAPIVIQVQK
jgi:hypothetical protein